MVPRTRPSRSGITLTEILIAILIMGVGLISLATLFPLGLLRLREAQRNTRSTYMVESATQEIETRSLLQASEFTNQNKSPWYWAQSPNPLLNKVIPYFSFDPNFPDHY